MLGKRIQEVRKNNHLTLKEFGKLFNLGESTISLYESGKRTPDFQTLTKISNHFGVSTDYLLGNTTNTALRIPVLGVIPAGIPIEAIEDIIDYEEVPESWGQGGNEYFALKIKGDSMLPEYRAGDVIIFKKQNVCDNNEDCAVLINGNDATFKRVERLDEGIILKPLNPAYESKFYSNAEIERLPIRIIGVFRELRRSRQH